MNNRLHVFLILLFFSGISYGQLAITWQNCFGGSDEDIPSDMVKSNDGGYVIIGYTGSDDGDISYNHGEHDVWLVKVDSFGNLIWEKTFGGSEGDAGYRIIKDNNGCYYLLNNALSSDFDITFDPYPQSVDYWVVKIDSSWNIVWNKILGGTWLDRVQTGVLTYDEGIIVQGHTGSPDGHVTTYYGQYDIWQVKLTSSGDFVWDFTIGSLGFDYGQAIIQANDNGYLVGGYTRVEDGGGNIDCIPYSWYGEALLVKLDSNANIEWQQCYGGSGDEQINALLEVEDGYMLLAGAESNDGDLTGTGYHGELDIWIIKVDYYGNIVWSKCYGGSKEDLGYKIFSTIDGGFIIFGVTRSNNGDVNGNHAPGWNDIWVFKINSIGEIVWQQCIGGAGDERLFHGVLQQSDNKYIIAAETNTTPPSYDVTCSLNHGIYDYWIFELTDTTVSINENDEIKKNDLLAIYPNPAWNTINCKLNISDLSCKYEIYNIYGLRMNELVVRNTVDIIQIDVSNYPAGVYIAVLKSDKEIIRRSKFVVRR